LTGVDGAAWADATAAAALLALDPVGLGGIVLRARAGPVRERWLVLLRAALAPAAPMRKIPPCIGDAQLLGGLDLAATLAAGRPVAARGMLAEADGGVVLLPMAERLPAATAARLAQVLDGGHVPGTGARARLGVVALDESASDEDAPPRSLLDRLGLHLDLDAVAPREAVGDAPARAMLVDARLRLGAVTLEEDFIQAICAAALALGIDSVRAPLFALRVARASAALAGRDRVADDDLALAVRLVLAPRATLTPHAAAPQPPAPPPDDSPQDDATTESPADTQALTEILLAAARAALPGGLLGRPHAGTQSRAGRTVGRAGELRSGAARGRPIGTRAGDPRDGGRLNVVETLRAAAPWQPLRRAHADQPASGALRLHIRKSDFRLTRHIERRETTTIFGLDASGSSALNRLAEAKGAIELLLAECYVRRDRVAVVAFRGRVAELLLPPTRALARARRELAGLPGGGGTPLVLGIDALAALAATERRAQRTPSVVLLTDGRANVARDGTGGRARAEAEALAAARRLIGTTALLVDTSPRPNPFARQLAVAMGGHYLPLPYPRAEALSEAVRAFRP
jgi:magnesium chelatase subunit D